MCSKLMRVTCVYDVFLIFLLIICLTRIPQTLGQLKCGERMINSESHNDPEVAVRGRWPWHALIYTRPNDRFGYRCGGSIIDKKHILTAAECLHNDEQSLLSAKDVIVWLGQTTLDETSDYSQEHYVSKLMSHPNYTEVDKGDNIGLVRLSTVITMTDFIQPVCIWNLDDSFKSIIDTNGLIIGFEVGISTVKIQEINTQVLDFYTCVNSEPYVAESYLWRKEYCAKLNLRSGNGGVGMIFFQDGNWFIRGVAVYTICPLGVCNVNLTGFTDVAIHKDWIAQYVTPTVPSNQWIIKNTLKQLECGSRKIRTQFLIYNAPEAKEGFWPWHAAIYAKRKQTFEYICGGSILDSNMILTSGHCLYLQRGLLSKDQITVVLGQNQLNYASNQTQIHRVSKLIPHPYFRPGNVSHDIGLIQLSTNIMMTDYVQPVCLWQNADYEWILDNQGIVVGFGETENGEASKHLREAVINVVDHWTCIKSDREIYGRHLTPEMLCGKGSNNISACKGDSGGGLVYEYEGSWFIRAIVSFIPGSTFGSCDSTKYTVFTDVAKYAGWILQFVDPTKAAYEIDQLEQIALG